MTGLPNEPVNAVRQDPQEPRLLYAATENGAYVSFDAGAHWQSLQLGLPHTSVRDLIVHGNDAIVATHGRGFWILDDVTPLRALAREGTALLARGGYFFAPAPAYRVRRSLNTDTPLPPEEPTGENPPDGAILDYALAGNARRVTIAIADESGRVVRRYASDDPEPAPIPDLDKPAYWERPFRRPATGEGMHRFVWDLREPPPQSVAQDLPISAVPHDTPRVPEGALVVPGRYTVTLDADGLSLQRSLTVVMDPRVAMSAAQLRQQYTLARELTSLMGRSFRDAAAAKSAGHESGARLFESINESAAQLLDTIDGADAPPTSQATAAVGTLERAFERNRGPRSAETRVEPGFSGTSHSEQDSTLERRPSAMNALRLALAVSILAGLACAAPVAAQMANGTVVTVTMNAQNGSGEDGSATLTQTADGVVVLITLKNAPAADQPAHIHPGTCANLTPAPKYPLTNVANGMSRTIVKGVTLQQLTSGTFAINVHKSTADLGTYVSCGDIKTS